MLIPDGFEDYSRLILTKPGIYLLYLGNVCVYVGRTTNLVARLNGHQLKFAFDRCYFMACKEHELETLEQRMIFMLEPTRNKTHKRPTMRANQQQTEMIRNLIKRDNGVA